MSQKNPGRYVCTPFGNGFIIAKTNTDDVINLDVPFNGSKLVHVSPDDVKAIERTV